VTIVAVIIIIIIVDNIVFAFIVAFAFAFVVGRIQIAAEIGLCWRRRPGDRIRLILTTCLPLAPSMAVGTRSPKVLSKVWRDGVFEKVKRPEGMAEHRLEFFRQISEYLTASHKFLDVID
jgi:hypothetical protein